MLSASEGLTLPALRERKGEGAEKGRFIFNSHKTIRRKLCWHAIIHPWLYGFTCGWKSATHTHTLGVIILICSTWFDIARWSNALFKSMSEWHVHLKRLHLCALAYVLPGCQVIHEESSLTVSAALCKCASPAKCLYKQKHIWTIYLPAAEYESISTTSILFWIKSDNNRQTLARW